MAVKISRNTFATENSPSLSSYAAIVGKLEGEGPLGRYFDETEQDSYFGQNTWEQGESELQRRTLAKAMEKGGLSAESIDFMFAGDLLNQCIGSTFGLKDFSIPIFGIYGACSTMSEGIALASLMSDSGLGKHIAAVTSSHFCSAERQFRFPLSYGCVRTPTAQWTCTASGAVIVSDTKQPPFVKGCTVGKIVDLGVTDANNMGAAMAPAAAYVIKTYLDDRGFTPDSFDAIITGDLGTVGSSLLIELLRSEGMDISKQHKDCGLMIFDRDEQDVHAGGSGCGCSGSVLCGYFLDKVRSGELKNILFCATGALMSTTATQQGESIPSISHAVHISHFR